MYARLIRLSLTFLLGISVLVLGSAPASAQMYAQRYGESTFEITPQASYFFSTDVAFSNADLNISDGAGYGLTLNVKIQRDLQFELFWVGSTTSAELLEYQGQNLPQPSLGTFDIATNYFMAGATQMLKGTNVKPFGTFAVGAAWWSPTKTGQSTVEVSDEVRFAMGIGAGVKIFFSEKVGLRLHGRLLFPLNFTGGGMYFGTGGAGLAVGAGIPVMQGDLSAGLIIGLGD
jgi:hypothetical protein